MENPPRKCRPTKVRTKGLETAAHKIMAMARTWTWKKKIRKAMARMRKKKKIRKAKA